MSDWFDESDVEKAARAALEKEFELEGLTKKQREFQWDALEEEERFLHTARMRAALSAVKPKSEWRPISDAPKMKTILLFGPTEFSKDRAITNWRMETGFWSSAYADDPEWSPWQWGGYQLSKYRAEPTHWMPLPLPPAPTEE